MKKLFTIFFLAGATITHTNAQTVSGGDMEKWVSTGGFPSQQRPSGWFSTDSLIGIIKTLSGKPYPQRVAKSTTVFSGGLASAKMTSPPSATDSFPTILANANIKFNMADITAGDYSKIQYLGGTNVTKRVVFGHAYTQYTSASSADTGVMTLTAFKNGIGVGGTDSVIGSGSKMILGSSAFVKTTCSISYKDATTIPDRIVVTFTTSRKAVPVAGTTLYVDDVTLSDPTGIETPMVNDANVQVFPNPAVNKLHISTEINEPMTVQMYNTTGQIVLTQNIGNKADINVSGLAAGNYIYVIANAANGHKYYSATFSKQ